MILKISAMESVKFILNYPVESGIHCIPFELTYLINPLPILSCFLVIFSCYLSVKSY